MPKRRAIGLAAAALLMLTPGALGCEALRDGVRGVVSAVPDGDTVLLEDGTAIRLIGLQAPKLPLGRDFEPWPLAETARSGLEALVLGQEVRLRHGGERRDRHGRALGQLFLTADDTWIQQRLLALGLARVYSFPDNRACIAELMAAETAARTSRLGIWSNSDYSVRAADQPQLLLARAGHYEIVEGRVLAAGAAGSRIFLNFGRRWKEDFTAVIERAAQKLFAESGLDPLRLDGALVRIRGWVDDRDGPRIEVTHPEQIEVLSTP